MTQTTPYQRYDFAAAARVERPLWIALNGWMLKSAELLEENWVDFSATKIGAVPSIIDAQKFSDLQESWTVPMLAVPIETDAESALGMLVIRCRDVLVLLMDILGGDASGDSDRELTSVEISLVKLVFEQSCLCLGQGWPEQQPLNLKFGEIDAMPNRSRMFAPDEMLLTCGLNIQIGEHASELNCVFMKSNIERLLAVDLSKKDKPNSGQSITVESLSEVEVELRAWFGTAEISVDDLASISRGDIVVLDQAIEDPLNVTANDEPAFVAWPGRQKNRQVLKLSSKRHDS